MKTSQIVAAVILIALLAGFGWGGYTAGKAIIDWAGVNRGAALAMGAVAVLILLCTGVLASSRVRAARVARQVRSQDSIVRLYLEVLELFQPPAGTRDAARVQLERRLALEASDHVLRQYIHCRQAWRAGEGFEQAYCSLIESMRRDIRDQSYPSPQTLIVQLLAAPPGNQSFN